MADLGPLLASGGFPGYPGGVNPFRHRIDRGEILTLDDLRGLYKAEVKRLHPDLHGGSGPAVDFDRLRRDFDEACQYWVETRSEPPAGGGPEAVHPGAPPPDTGAFLDEFRNLMARGFPVNVQAAGRNKAYAGSVRSVSKFLADRFEEEDFFAKVNGEARLLKRRDPSAFWYIMQICWGTGDWQLTGYYFHRRTVVRHRDFVAPTLIEEGCLTLARFLDFLVECTGP